jgi:putative FmdB family regulatory protein
MNGASNFQRKNRSVPLYEYRCKNCGHTFEKIQSFSAPEEKECPVCGGPVERLISAPAIQFNGSGWYVSDYAGKSKTGAMKASADGDGASSAAKPAEGSSSSSASDSGGSSSASSSPSAAKSE